MGGVVGRWERGNREENVETNSSSAAIQPLKYLCGLGGATNDAGQASICDDPNKKMVPSCVTNQLEKQFAYKFSQLCDCQVQEILAYLAFHVVWYQFINQIWRSP